METLISFINNTWSVTLELSLWLLIGLFIAGLLHILVPDHFIKHHLGHKKGFLAVFKAVIFGVPMPLCSCGVIPAALGIKKQGAGDGAAMGFLISTPQTGIDSIMISGSMLGFPFAIFKLFSAFTLGLVGGGITQMIDNRTPQASDITPSEEGKQPKRGIKEIFSFAIDDLLKMIWKWLVIGILVSAAITTWLPKDFFSSYLPENRIGAMAIVLLISLPMYVCATASVPIAAALVYAGMPVGGALVFLMAGPASNIATIGAVYRAFGLKKLAIYLGTIIIGSMVCGYLFDSIITVPTTLKTMAMSHSTPLTIAAAILFIILIIRFIIQDIADKLRSKNNTSCCCNNGCSNDIERKIILVTGMSCEGCASHLKKTLLKLDAIHAVSVDVATGKVELTGSSLDDIETIKTSVEEAGYHLSKRR